MARIRCSFQLPPLDTAAAVELVGAYRRAFGALEFGTDGIPLRPATGMPAQGEPAVPGDAVRLVDGRHGFASARYAAVGSDGSLSAARLHSVDLDAHAIRGSVEFGGPTAGTAEFSFRQTGVGDRTELRAEGGVRRSLPRTGCLAALAGHRIAGDGRGTLGESSTAEGTMRLGRWRVSGTVVAESAAELRLDLRLRGPFAFVGAWFARRMLRSRLPDSIGRVAVGLDELRKDIHEAGGADVLLHHQIWEPPPAEQNHPDPGVDG